MDNPMLPVPAPEEQETLPPPGSLPPVPGSDPAAVDPPGLDSWATRTPETSFNRVDVTRFLGDARAPAGYVIERELGRGGMGVVYLARDVALHRPCALKMILAGVHSGAAEMERFRTEAQAIARLQHPGIVQVFEIGEHDGKPFMALEYCSGGSLDAKLAKNPLTSKQAATLVKALAEAVHAAHLAQVIHRDLKPANVLLTEKGEPKVTDFGLAKKLDEQGATRTGSVMGTPSYMPPEQAEGKKDIGPTADVYALGAILYECLAFRPPFRAATPLDTIMQLLTEEPVPVRQLNPQAPVDLETICSKCLQKDPNKRYATAEELADDLGRYLGGEPIKARPVGAIERGVKWVRRNRVLTGAIVSVAMALLLGTAVSIHFGFREAAAAQIAKENEIEAIAARNNLAKTAEDLMRARDGLEGTLARSLLRPLALQGGDNPMTEGELEAMWELAEARPGRLGYRFVEEATRSPATSQQLRDRAAMALNAAVGLDEGQRANVESRLLSQFDAAFDENQKTFLAQAVSAWEPVGSPLATRSALQLVLALKKTRDGHSLAQLSDSLSALAGQLEPKDAAKVVVTLTEVMKSLADSKTLGHLTLALSALATRMEPKDGAALLIKVMTDTNQPNAFPRLLAKGVTDLAPRMDPKDAPQVVAILIQAMKVSKDPNTLYYLAQGLSPVAVRVEPMEAAQAAAVLIQAMEDSKDALALWPLAQALSSLTAKMEPQNGALTTVQAATIITGRMATILTQGSKDPDKINGALLNAGGGLRELAARMEPNDAAQAAAILIQVMKDPKNADAVPDLAQCLSPLAEGLEPRAAAQIASILIQTMKDPKNAKALPSLVNGLSSLRARMEPNVTAQATSILIEAMMDPKNENVLPSLTRSLSTLAAELGPKDAVQAASILVKAMKDPKNANYWESLALVIPALVARLEAKEANQTASQTAAIVTQAMEDPKNGNALRSLALSLSNLAAWMEPREGAAILLKQMKDPRNANVLMFLAEGLPEVAKRMNSKDAAQAAFSLLQDMKDANNRNAWPFLEQGFSAFTVRMESNDAAQAAAILMHFMKDANTLEAWPFLAKGLSSLAVRMEPREAEALCKKSAMRLTSAINKTTEPYLRSGLAQSLVALAVRHCRKTT